MLYNGSADKDPVEVCVQTVLLFVIGVLTEELFSVTISATDFILECQLSENIDRFHIHQDRIF